MSDAREVRSISRQIEARAATEAGPRILEGYAIVYGRSSEMLSDGYGTGFYEIIAPGAFDRTLRESPDVVALFNHDWSSVLGRTSSGTLELTSDSEGLAFRLDCPDTTVGNDLYVSVKRRDIRGCSFAFSVAPGGEDIKLIDGNYVRTLYDLNLYEVTIGTAIPAYPDTTLDIRTRMGKSPIIVPDKSGIRRKRLRLLDLDAV